MKNQLLPNPHTGEILLHEFMEELNLSQNALARALAVPPNRIHAIVNGTRRVTADTDLRLAVTSVFRKAISCACKIASNSPGRKRK
jgi:addiction module HigA family antidote